MAPSRSTRPYTLTFLLASTIISISQFPQSTQAFFTSLHRNEINGGEGRSLLSFKESPNGGNVTFKCSPSGPCLSCLYSEKRDDKYRCSETGYHIPLKCVEIKGGSKVGSNKKTKKDRSTIENTQSKSLEPVQDKEEHATLVGHRRLLDDSSKSVSTKSQTYVTYRSCIPAVFEEKLSVLGFEAVMLGLLLGSGLFIYFRRRRTIAMPGVGGPPVRVQSNPRF